MHITVINDCADENAAGRQVSRLGVLVPNASISFVGVGSYADLQASGNLIDTLDAFEGREGAILVNVAPRHKGSTNWSNGTPFCYFTYRKTIVVASVDGFTLSLVRKLRLVDSISIMDIAQVANDMHAKGFITEDEVKYLPHTQFRSFDFTPRVGAAMLSGYIPPAENYDIENIAPAPEAVWWVDNFGNIKTTLFPEEIDFIPGEERKTKLGSFRCFERLSYVPKGEVGLIVGSSGLGNRRFLEIVIQGGRASDTFGIEVGDLLKRL